MANEDGTSSETSLSRRLRIALKSIITGHLKDNHDDTLVEKFGSFISTEIDTGLLEKIVHKEDIFGLLDSQLPSNTEATDLIRTKDDLEVVLRLYGALFSHESIFQLYVKNKIKEPINVLSTYIKILRTFCSCQQLPEELNLLKYIFFTFLNQVLLHEQGSKWVSCEVLSIRSAKSEMMFELILSQLKGSNSYYVEKVIYSSLANLINIIFKYPSSLAVPQIEFFLRVQFSQIENFERQLLLNIVDSIIDKEAFFENYSIMEALMVSFRKLEFGDEKSCENAIKLIASLSLCMEDNCIGIDILVDFTNENKLSSINCFCCTSFLGSLLQIKRIPQDEFANLWLAMLQSYFWLITQPNARCNELPNTFCRDSILKSFEQMSFSQFEQNSLKLLAKVHPANLPFSIVERLLGEIGSLLKCITNRKNLNFIFFFLGRLVSEYLTRNSAQSCSVLGGILSLYCDHFKTIPAFQKSILRSVCDIIQSWSSLDSDSILPSFTVIFSLMVEQFDQIDVTSFEDDDLLDLSVEIIYFFLLNCSSCDLFLDDINSKIKHLLSVEFTMVQSDCLETSTRANIVTTLLIVYKFFHLKNFFEEPSQIGDYLDRLIQDFQDYDLSFRQQFFFNLQNILKRFTFNQVDCLQFLKFFIEICSSESDSELQHMLLNIIELIYAQLVDLLKDNSKLFEILVTSKLFCLFHFLLNDSLVTHRVKQRTVDLWTRLSPLVVSCYSPSTNHSFLGVDLSQSIQFMLSSDLIYLVSKSQEYPKLDLLEDILTTSTLSQDITMDCY